MRSVSLALTLTFLACKDTPKPPPATGSGSGAGPVDPHAGLFLDAADTGSPIDWAACDAAITKAAAAPMAARVQILVDGCHVCGDWSPLLHWNTLQTAGGPKRIEIENAMLACNAYCLGDARMKFLGTLDDARGKSSRLPWKQLALLCKDKVSAGTDDRFIDGVYFALDRIGRFVGAKRADLAPRLASIDLALPPIGVSGVGPPLAAAPGVSANVSPLQITVLAKTISVGQMPRAHLTADGVQLVLGDAPYPGKVVGNPAEVTAALTVLAKEDKSVTVALIAPPAAPASALVPVITAAAKAMPVYLAARATESPVGWDLAGQLPIALGSGGKNVIRVTKDMTVQQLADAIGKLPAGTTQVGIAGP